MRKRIRLSDGLLDRVLEKHGRNCYFCGAEFGLIGMQFDHLQPWSRGGQSSLGNLVPACGTCNKLKGAMTLDEARPKLLARLGIAALWCDRAKTVPVLVK